jgi:hypothetical protein
MTEPRTTEPTTGLAAEIIARNAREGVVMWVDTWWKGHQWEDRKQALAEAYHQCVAMEAEGWRVLPVEPRTVSPFSR